MQSLNALRALVKATHHMTDTNPATGDAFPDAHRKARDVLALHDSGMVGPADEFLAYLETLDQSEFVRRLAGSVRKLKTLE